MSITFIFQSGVVLFLVAVIITLKELACRVYVQYMPFHTYSTADILFLREYHNIFL